MYGFYDALSIFSSTLVLMISAAMDDSGVNDSVDDDAIGLAWSLLRSMKDDGNVPAGDYHDQLVQLKDALSDACAKKGKIMQVAAPASNKHYPQSLLGVTTVVTEIPQTTKEAIVNQDPGPHPQIPAPSNSSVGASDVQFLDSIWSHSQAQPQGQTAWAPAALESMFNTSATDQPLWDIDWESVGML